MKRASVVLLAALCLAGCAWADPRFVDYPALGFCTGSGVRLRDEPSTGKESKIIGRLDNFDRLVVLGETSVEGQTWYEVEHPKKKGEAWVFGDYVQPQFGEDELDSLRARTLLSLTQTFGVTPEKARLLFGKPRKDKSKKLDAGGGIALTDLAWAGRTAGYLNGQLVHAGLMEGKLPFGEARVGGPASDLVESLGNPASRSDENWEYRLDDMTILTFEIADGKIAGMNYQVYYDIAP